MAAKIPFITGLYWKLNYINKILTYPCALPGPVVWAETGLEAALPELFQLASFSCLDIVKARAGISWKCGRTIKAVAEQTVDPEVFGATRFLYKFLAPIEEALWYFFLVEQTLSFVQNWQTLIMRAEGCLNKDNQFSQYTGSPGFVYEDEGGALGWGEITHTTWSASDVVIQVVPGHKLAFTWSCGWGDWLLNEATIDMFVEDAFGNILDSQTYHKPSGQDISCAGAWVMDATNLDQQHASWKIGFNVTGIAQLIQNGHWATTRAKYYDPGYGTCNPTHGRPR